MRDPKSRPPRSAAQWLRYRPKEEVSYYVSFEDSQFIFSPAISEKKKGLPSFNYKSHESIAVITSSQHNGSLPFWLNIASIASQLQKREAFNCFVSPNSTKEDFVVLLRPLHFRLKSIISFLERQVLLQIVEDIIKDNSLPAPIEEVPPVEEKSEEIESAIKDEYNTSQFEFNILLNAPKGVDSLMKVVQPSISDKKSYNKATQMSRSWNTKRYRQVASLRLISEKNLLFEFFLGGKYFSESFLSDPNSSSLVSLKFENSIIIKVPSRELILMFKEISGAYGSDVFRVKVDLVLKENWKILHFYLPSIGFPDCCRLGELLEAQITERDVQLLLLFEDGTRDTVWLNAEDAIDVVSCDGPNYVDVWPNYFQKQKGIWPSRVGVLQSKYHKCIYFPESNLSVRTDDDGHRHAVLELLETTRGEMNNNNSFASEYVRLLRQAKRSKESELLPMFIEFLNFINIPPVAHQDMFEKFILSRK